MALCRKAFYPVDIRDKFAQYAMQINPFNKENRCDEQYPASHHTSITLTFPVQKTAGNSKAKKRRCLKSCISPMLLKRQNIKPDKKGKAWLHSSSFSFIYPTPIIHIPRQTASIRFWTLNANLNCRQWKTKQSRSGSQAKKVRKTAKKKRLILV